MALNTVQQDFVNNAARPHMEVLVRILHELDTYIADYDAIQSTSDVLPTDANVLDDAGISPRDDAPNLTGADLQTMRDLSANMSAISTGGVKTVLISKMKRSLSSILRLG